MLRDIGWYLRERVGCGYWDTNNAMNAGGLTLSHSTEYIFRGHLVSPFTGPDDRGHSVEGLSFLDQVHPHLPLALNVNSVAVITRYAVSGQDGGSLFAHLTRRIEQ